MRRYGRYGRMFEFDNELIFAFRDNNVDDDELIEAIIDDNINKVKSLLEAGVDVNAKINNGISPWGYTTYLTTASRYGYTDIVEMLLEAGANIDAQDGYDRTALSEAIIKDYPDIVELLLDAGADPDIHDADGYSPLEHAVSVDDPEIVELLLHAGAYINSPEKDRVMKYLVNNDLDYLVK